MSKLLKKINRLILICFLLSLAACANLPEGVEPITGFDAKRYAGKWYEIARLDNRFEKGLSNVTADYQLRDDGHIDVINRGFSAANNEWKQAKGLAKFVDKADKGQLKVSFFGPFYGGYNIVALDKDNYDYALVAGNDRSYLWVLSRRPQLSAPIFDQLVAKAKSLNFPVNELIRVEQTQ